MPIATPEVYAQMLDNDLLHAVGSVAHVVVLLVKRSESCRMALMFQPEGRKWGLIPF